MNLFDMLKADKGIPVSDPMARLWGYLYQQKHGVSEISGVPPLRFTSRGGYLQDYRIYGNTVQDGIPTPENPVEVRGVGEYDAELNGYKIPVTVSNGTNSVTTPVYIGSEPLHKIRNYADYVDFKRGVVVRRICKVALTGKETYTTGRLDKFRIPITITLQNSIISVDNATVRSSHYITNYSSEGDEVFKDVYTIRRGYNGYPTWFFNPKSFFSGEISSENCARQFKAYLAAQYSAGTPVTVWYVLAEPEEEPLENLLPIQTIKGSDILTVGTTVQPSEMYIKGKIKPIGGNEND